MDDGLQGAIGSVYVFDLDGVITNPQNSQVNEGVINKMYQLLLDGTYVTANTGRSYNWVDDNLVRRLKAYNNSQIFERFSAVCEKGGEIVTLPNGQPLMSRSEFALPPAAYDKAKSIFEANRQSLQSMFWDATKRTMATVEKQPIADLEIFRTEQKILIDKLEDAFRGQEVRVDPTTIATDVESASAGKYSGAKLIYRWIRQVEPAPATSFICIGDSDSASDFEMSRYFVEQGASASFVYVGKQKINFITTASQYDQGTLEFLNAG